MQSIIIRIISCVILSGFQSVGDLGSLRVGSWGYILPESKPCEQINVTQTITNDPVSISAT